MLNQALTELQTALALLEKTVHYEQTESEWSNCISQVTANVNQSIEILQNLEHTLASGKLTLITSSESEKKSDNYLQHSWQKTA